MEILQLMGSWLWMGCMLRVILKLDYQIFDACKNAHRKYLNLL